MEERIGEHYATLLQGEGANLATGWARKGITKLLLAPTNAPWVVITLGVTFASFYGAAMLGKETHLEQVRHANLFAAIFFSLSYCFVGMGLGLFEKENRLSRYSVVRLNALAFMAALGIAVVLMVFVFFKNTGRFSLIYGSTAALISNLLFYTAVRKLLKNFPHRYVVLGEQTKITESIAEYLGSSPLGRHYSHMQRIRDFITQHREDNPEQLNEVLDRCHISDLVLTREVEHDSFATKVAMRAMQGGVRVVDEVKFYSELCRRIPIEYLSIPWVLNAGFDSQNPMKNLIKRTFDLILSGILIVLLAPLLVIIAILVKATSPGPVLYRQSRQGRFSKQFTIIKFRTMHVEDGAATTDQNDERITGMGRLLRPLHIDELPQLWNIFLGHMSFVGPRPESFEIVEKVREFVPVFEVRHMIRPGLTGLAQISQGKTDDSKQEIERKLSFDLYYLKNYSLFFDLWIMLRTFFTLARHAW